MSDEPRNLTPSRKVGSGALAGALSVIVVYILNRYGVEIPGEVASAITTAFTFIVSYFVRDDV